MSASRGHEAEQAPHEAEQFLRKELDYNRTHGIYPSDNEIMERMLRNPDTLRPLYCELGRSLRSVHGREAVLSLMIRVAVVAHPKRTAGIRDEKKQAKKLNAEIHKLAPHLRKLAALLRERQTDCPSINPLLLPHVADLMALATQQSRDRFKPHLFDEHLAPRLEPLRASFDWKYWPDVDELLLALADALSESTEPESLPTVYPAPLDKAISGRSASGADFTTAMDEAINDLKFKIGSGVPRDFRLTAGAIECFCGVAMMRDLSQDTIKKKRRRQAEKSRDSSRAKLP